jgi:hypothetical protein
MLNDHFVKLWKASNMRFHNLSCNELVILDIVKYGK